MAHLATAPAWHHAAHLPLRREVMMRLRQHPILAVNPALQRDAARHGLPSLLQRLEWMLYHAAFSLAEYSNADSLERRVQALVTHYRRQPAGAGGDGGEASKEDASSPRRRRRPSGDSEEDARPSVKRQHTAEGDQVDCRIHFSTGTNDRSGQRARHGCSLSHNLDLLRHVFSFLDGHETLRCRAISRFFHLHAPSFVVTLRFESSALRSSADVAGLAELLLQCRNLRSVSISSRANLANVKAGVVFPRALSQPSAATAPSVGHQVALELADAVRRGGCRKLKALELHAPFDFANESDAAIGLLKALAAAECGADADADAGAPMGLRSQPRRSTLKRLVLDATFLGDKGVRELARVVGAHESSFRRLKLLDLRNNFVGEGGCQALLAAVQASLPRLETLDLRQNILSDGDAVRIADLLDQPAGHGRPGAMAMAMAMADAASSLAVPRLRRVQLDGNFIGCEGFHAIAIALCARREVVLRSSSSEDSLSEDLDAALPVLEGDEPMDEQEAAAWA